MSFAIDEDKIVEMLKASGEGYTVSSSKMEPTIDNYSPYYGHMWASGTVVTDRAAMSAQARRHLMTARGKIVKSGIALKGTSELTREIDAARGGE